MESNVDPKVREFFREEFNMGPLGADSLVTWLNMKFGAELVKEKVAEDSNEE